MEINFSQLMRFVENKDFTSYIFLYPPMALWRSLKKQESVVKFWEESLSRYPFAGIYIHFPFCKTKCHYCRFFSQEIRNTNDKNLYLKALSQEADIFSRHFKGIPVKTLYIGGGSPSLLEKGQLEELFAVVYRNFTFNHNKQVIFEANPEFLDIEKIRILRNNGVSRLTIGVQTMNTRLIKRLNRTQSISSVYSAYSNARKSGIPYINIDLMCGLPSQTFASFVSDLLKIVTLKPDVIHVSRFMPTSFVTFTQRGNLLTEKEISLAERMEQFVGYFLPRNGYKMLEYDAWGLDEKAQNYQLTEVKRNHASFLGLGPGAVSRISGHFQYVNTPEFSSYCKYTAKRRPPIFLGHKLSSADNMRGFILNNLWYGKLSGHRFRALFGEPIEKRFGNTLNNLSRCGLLTKRKDAFFSVRRRLSKEHLLELQQAFYSKSHTLKLAKYASHEM